MTEETGTLAELNVKPGDVFELANLTFGLCTLQSDGRILIGDGPEYWGRYSEQGHLMGRIVSRASDTPKTWAEMTEAERRDISFSAMSGQVIELDAYGGWVEWDGKTPLCETHQAIRVRPPEPRRETEHVTIVNADGMVIGRGTVTTENGKPDCASIRMEEL